ncbi:hypothetical protein BYT27DRAFT_7191574 [Phlegmacium glaucopus]|nr:hypothetical protein BYT27DRAFT_7191574 [Phlegmacium glaucopus]
MSVRAVLGVGMILKMVARMTKVLGASWMTGLLATEDDEDHGHYEDPVDDNDDSEPPPACADDALGPEDGERDGDEMYLAW